MSPHKLITDLKGSTPTPPKRPTDDDYRKRIFTAQALIAELQNTLDEFSTETESIQFAALDECLVWLLKNGTAKPSFVIHTLPLKDD